MRAAVALVVCLAACSDPVIDMHLQMPTDPAQGAMFDMTCVTAVEVLAHGTNWPADANDTKRSCIKVAGATNLAGVQRALTGKFTLPIPDDGLGSIEVNGRTGDCTVPPVDVSPGDLLFYAGNKYLGADSITLDVAATQSCAKAPLKLRIYDLMKLIASHVLSPTDCTNAALIDESDLDPGAAFGTFVPTLAGITWNEGFTGGDYVAGLVTTDGMTTVGPTSCFGADAGNRNDFTLACLDFVGPKVCAAADEIEVPVMDGQLSYNAIDPVKVGKWGGMVIGSVWTTAGAGKAPFAGATVKVDKNHGEVVFLGPNADGSALLVEEGSTATGPSGMFALYADQIVEVTVTANGMQRKVKLGGKTDLAAFPPAIALVLVN